MLMFGCVNPKPSPKHASNCSALLSCPSHTMYFHKGTISLRSAGGPLNNKQNRAHTSAAS